MGSLFTLNTKCDKSPSVMTLHMTLHFIIIFLQTVKTMKGIDRESQ